MTLKSKSNLLREKQDYADKAEKDSVLNGMEHLDLKVFDDVSLLSELTDQWNDLSGKADSSIYASPQWVKSWWVHFGMNRQRSLFVITIWEDQRLIALAPMYSGYTTLGSAVIERRLQIIGSGGSPNEQSGFLDDYGISDFLDFIVDKEFEDSAAKMLAGFLAERKDFHTITFHQTGDDSFIIRKLYPELKKKGIQLTKVCTDRCPFIDLGSHESLTDYIRQVKSNARRRFRQTLRAMGPEKEFVIEDIDSAKGIEESTEILIELHQSRWNELGFPGVFYDHRFRSFFKDIIRFAFENQSLWFSQARDTGGEVCASRMCLLYNGRYYDYISGFNANLQSSKFRPGIGLLLKLVETALEDDVSRIELLRGEETYKYDFTDRSFKNWKLTMKTGKNKTGILKTASAFIRIKALIYKYGSREWRLLRVQKEKAGLFGMLQGYIKFRWKSVQLKMSPGE